MEDHAILDMHDPAKTHVWLLKRYATYDTVYLVSKRQ
jgi:hypothetical protein